MAWNSTFHIGTDADEASRLASINDGIVGERMNFGAVASRSYLPKHFLLPP